jgi:hypothetical protein
MFLRGFFFVGQPLRLPLPFRGRRWARPTKPDAPTCLHEIPAWPAKRRDYSVRGPHAKKAGNIKTPPNRMCNMAGCAAPPTTMARQSGDFAAD